LKFIFSILTTLLTIAFTGCNNENPVNQNLPANPKIMFINASPYSSTGYVSFIINGDSTSPLHVKYGNYAGYKDFKSGNNDITINFFYNTDTVTLNFTKSFEVEKYYSCIAYDAGSPSSAAAAFINDKPVIPNFNTIKVRVVNFLASEQPVDFYQIPGFKLFQNIDFATASDFSQLEPGTYNFSVKYSTDTSNTILQILGQNLSLPRAYSYFISGYNNSPIYIKTIY
jgi:hypothetical protein